jgi:hypothetical protein
MHSDGTTPTWKIKHQQKKTAKMRGHQNQSTAQASRAIPQQHKNNNGTNNVTG